MGTPRWVILRLAAETVRRGRSLLSRLLTGRRARREQAQEETDAFLTVPFRYRVLPGSCPHCAYRGPRRPPGRGAWWEPGHAYKE